MKRKIVVVIALFATLNLVSCGTNSGDNKNTQTITKTRTDTSTITPGSNTDNGTENTVTNTETTTETIIETTPTESQYPVNDNGIFAEYYSKAWNRLQEMSLEEKVGQVFLARCPVDTDIESIQTYHLGGYVLFRKDFEGKTSNQVIDKIDSYQRESSIPMIMATDEEGGTVVRISSNPNLSSYRFQSPQDIFSTGGYTSIYEDTLTKGKLLKHLGINLNLAPVSDITNDTEAYIYGRTFGKSAEETGEFVKNVIEATKEVGIGSSLKHFPGYGGNLDTHTGMATDTRTYESFEKNDFIPFIDGIQAGAETILVSHNIVTAMDDQYPASLSEKVNHIVREELGFTGVILTDDLEMDAIKHYTNNENPAVQALNAGNDMLIITDYEEGYEAILAAVKEGSVKEDRLEEAVFRIVALKYYLGLFR